MGLLVSPILSWPLVEISKLLEQAWEVGLEALRNNLVSRAAGFPKFYFRGQSVGFWVLKVW